MTKKRLKLIKSNKQNLLSQYPSKDTIDKAFISIRNSSRYGVLKNLHISGVLNTKSASKFFGKKTVSDVVENSAESLLKIEKIPIQLLKDLLIFIQSVSEANCTEIKNNNQDNKNITSIEHLNELAPIEATQQLEKVINNLRNSPDFQNISHRLVSSFWDEAWPRAPFEESLTLKQICSLDVAKILRKRSLTPPKVGAMIAALDRAYQTTESKIKPITNTNKKDQSQSSSDIIEIINHYAPALIPQLSTLLSTAGMSSEQIANYISANLHENLITIISQLILKKMGVNHPCIRGIELQSVWTMNRHFIETVLEGIWAQLPLSKQQVENQLYVLLPNLDQKITSEIFSIGACYLIDKDRWEKKMQ